jgi:hypothetical protein
MAVVVLGVITVVAIAVVAVVEAVISVVVGESKPFIRFRKSKSLSLST